MHRALVAFLILALGVQVAAAAESAYRLVRCVTVDQHGFAVSFRSEQNEQRRISFSSKGLAFGGNVKGEAKLGQVEELRLSPTLEVVFVKPEHAPVKFGPLSRECRDIIRQRAGAVLRVVDGQG